MPALPCPSSECNVAEIRAEDRGRNAPLPDGSVADDRLVSGARLAALDEDRFLRFKTEAFISDGDEILHAFGDSGLRVPSVNERAPLSAADPHAGAFEAIELPLDGIERDGKIL